MTIRSSGPLAALFLVALAACGPRSASPRVAPIPDRRTDDLVAELRSRHNDLLDALRRSNSEGIVRHLAPDAILILPTGDTVRGAPGIAAQVDELHRRFTVESVRATAAASVVRCTDGLLERTGDWSLQVVKPDDVRDFLRDAFGIRWTTRGDSLQISIISLAARTGLPPERSDCVSVESERYSGSRFALGYTIGLALPNNYTMATEHEFGRYGYTNPNFGMSYVYPEGQIAYPPSFVHLGGRVANKLWLTATGTRGPTNPIIARRNFQTTNYVLINRRHLPIGLSLDYQWRFIAAGVGPAIGLDRWIYQEIDYAGPTGKTMVHDLNYKKVPKGLTANVAINVPMGANFTLTMRSQFFRFPAEEFPTLRTGEEVRIRDFSTVLGFGLRASY